MKLLKRVFIGVQVLALLLVGAVLLLQLMKPDHHTPVHRYGWKTMHTFVYPTNTREEVVQMFEESYRGLRYEDYTMFAEGIRTGRYFNIEEPGFRKSSDETWPPPSNAFNIFFFGGSTTLGLGVADNETIPARVHVYLHMAFPRGNINVYNFARASYQSTQERILFNQLLLTCRPNFAVWIDGLNDFIFQYGPSVSQRVRDAVEKPVSFVTVDWSLFKRLYIYDLYCEEFNRFAWSDLQTNNCGTVAQTYLRNIEMDNAVCSYYGIPSLFFWQPIATYKYDLRFHPFVHQISGPHLNTIAGYKFMAKIHQSGGTPTNFVWLADMQQNAKCPLYVDSFHYNAFFSDEISKLVVSNILPLITQTNWASLPGQ